MSDLRRQLRQGVRGYEVRRSVRPQGGAGVRRGNEVTINGKPLTAREVSNEPLGSGDAVVLSGDNGVLHQERRREQVRPEIDRGKLSSEGKVTVLVTRTVSGQTELWLGGDRIPQLIFTVPSASLKVSSLELVGPAKTDWVVAIQWGNTAKMISGNGLVDWQVTDPRVALLSYLGGGFWSQSASYYSADPASFATTRSKSGDKDSELLGALGSVQGSSCYSTIEGLSTIAVEYCENYAIVGPRSLSSDFFDINEGLVQKNLPFIFRGQNTSNTTGGAQAQIVGGASGPGYLGPGGAPVDPLTPSITGIATFPKKTASGGASYTRSFSSSTHHVSLYGGQLTEREGTWSISASWQSSSEMSSGGNRRKVDFLGSVREFTSPNAFLWTIFNTAIEYWPFSPGSASQVYSDIVSSIQIDTAIAPGITKNYSATITAPGGTPNLGVGQAEYSFSGGCFFGGYAWEKETISADTPGEAITSAIEGTFRFGQGSRTRKFYFNWRGSDIEANSVYGDISRTWQPDENDSSRPKSTYATLLTPSDIFTKNIEAEVSVSRAVTINGKLSFQAEPNKIKAKVRSMKTVGNGTIRAAQYWDDRA